MPRPRASFSVSSGRDVYVPTESFAILIDGAERVFVKDQTRVREGHEILRSHGHLFKPMWVEYDVEAATAAPGEMR